MKDADPGLVSEFQDKLSRLKKGEDVDILELERLQKRMIGSLMSSGLVEREDGEIAVKLLENDALINTIFVEITHPGPKPTKGEGFFLHELHPRSISGIVKEVISDRVFRAVLHLDSPQQFEEVLARLQKGV